MNPRNIKTNISLPLILVLMLSISLISCSSNSSKESELNNNSKNIYNLNDVVKIGWKMKKGFSTEFPNATDAKWGFHQGREVAIIMYQNSDDAKNYGKISGSDQTEYIEPIDGIKAYGEKVEKTTCRGFAEYQTPYKLKGIEERCILSKNPKKSLTGLSNALPPISFGQKVAEIS